MDKMRWRYGDTNPVLAAVQTDTVIENGDLLWQDVDNAKPACLCVNPYKFKRVFLGVAMQQSRKNETGLIRVATTGVFEFDCNPQRWNLGNLTMPAFGKVGLLNQGICCTGEKGTAIGRVAKLQHFNLEPSVYVDIVSTVMRGGV